MVCRKAKEPVKRRDHHDSPTAKSEHPHVAAPRRRRWATAHKATAELQSATAMCASKRGPGLRAIGRKLCDNGKKTAPANS